MKVTGPKAGGAVGGAAGAKRKDGAGFSLSGLDEAQASASAAPAAGPAAVSSLDALMALQGAGDPRERRRRAVRRAGRLLDLLDEVKLALLDGGSAAPALERLRAAVREARDGVEDPRLEGVLDEIETRAAVELAKQEAAARAAA
jgi:hypothetical protein